MSRYYEKQREERGLGSRAEQTDRAIVSLTHEVGELRRQVAAVRKVHWPKSWDGTFDICSACCDIEFDATKGEHWPSSAVSWPCSTIRALGVE